MGLPLKEVIAEMTWHPAVEVQQTQLGHLSEDAIADVSVLNLRHGDFGYVDGSGALDEGGIRISKCELTIKDWQIRLRSEWSCSSSVGPAAKPCC